MLSGAYFLGGALGAVVILLCIRTYLRAWSYPQPPPFSEIVVRTLRDNPRLSADVHHHNAMLNLRIKQPLWFMQERPKPND